MNSQFHTPSLGDGFDLSGVEETATNTIGLDSNTQTVFQQSQADRFESKRMQGMDQSSLSLGNAEMNNYPVRNTNAGSITSGIFNITAHLNNNLNGNATSGQSHAPPTTMAARKQMLPSANDSNEPPKPLSPYTLFFRDTVSAIKQQNPNCAFADLTRIVSSMWEALDPVQKDIYNKKAEAAGNEYLKQLRMKQQNTQRNDGQTVSSIKNEEPLNATNASNFVPDQYDQTQQNSEIQMTVSQTSEAPMNAQPNVQAPETMPQQTLIARETPNMELCIRDGCNKRAIMNPDWEDEYCSNECVVIHCRNVFSDWVQQNKEAAGLQQ